MGGVAEKLANQSKVPSFHYSSQNAEMTPKIIKNFTFKNINETPSTMK